MWDKEINMIILHISCIHKFKEINAKVAWPWKITALILLEILLMDNKDLAWPKI